MIEFFAIPFFFTVLAIMATAALRQRDFHRFIALFGLAFGLVSAALSHSAYMHMQDVICMGLAALSALFFLVYFYGVGAIRAKSLADGACA